MLNFIRLNFSICLILFINYSSFVYINCDTELECNPRYEYERVCDCRSMSIRFKDDDDDDNNSFKYLPPFSNYIYCDNDDLKYHECYRENCPLECETRIRDLISMSQTNLTISQSGGNNICKWAVYNDPITETGLSVWVEYTPGICDVGKKQLLSDICCNKRCKCSLNAFSNSQYHSLEINKNEFETNEILFNYENELPKKEQYYDCSQSEFDECEQDCRQLFGNLINNELIKEKNVNEFDLFTKNDHNDNQQTFSDNLCKIINKPINYPGMDIKLLMNTRPGELTLNKEIRLGSLCCEIPCECILRFHNKTIDLTHLLINKSNRYYECSKEFDQCREECVDLIRDYVQNEEYYMRINTNGANMICESLGSIEYHEPGITVYYEIKTNEEKETIVSKEIMNLGNVCCSRPCNCELILRNYQANSFNEFSNTKFNSKLLTNLNEHLPKRNLSYDCSKQVEICIEDCKYAAGVYLNNDQLKTNTIQTTEVASLQHLDVFFEFRSAVRICETLNKKIDLPGVDVYLRYDLQNNNHPLVDGLFMLDDLHLGRICCNEKLVPSNKCKYHILPHINNTELAI